MEQILSEEQRQQRAREVYKRAYWSAFFVGFAILIALEIAEVVVQNWLKMGHSYPAWASGFPVLMLFGAHIWGFRAMRRAGLLREEREIIARSSAVSNGETLEFGYPKTVTGKLAFIAFFVLIGVGAWWMWRYQDEKTLGALGIFISLIFVILSVRSFNLPNLRLDDQGVLGYVYGSGLWPRLVRWDEIGSVQFDQISGLPAPPFKKDWVAETIVLKSKTGETLMTLNSNIFMGAPPGWKQRFIAELKRRLVSDEAA